MSRRDEADFDEPTRDPRADYYSNDEAGAAAAERHRAGSTRRQERLGKEDWEIPGRNEL